MGGFPLISTAFFFLIVYEKPTVPGLTSIIPPVRIRWKSESNRPHVWHHSVWKMPKSNCLVPMFTVETHSLLTCYWAYPMVWILYLAVLEHSFKKHRLVSVVSCTGRYIIIRMKLGIIYCWKKRKTGRDLLEFHLSFFFYYIVKAVRSFALLFLLKKQYSHSLERTTSSFHIHFLLC